MKTLIEIGHSHRFTCNKRAIKCGNKTQNSYSLVVPPSGAVEMVLLEVYADMLLSVIVFWHVSLQLPDPPTHTHKHPTQPHPLLIFMLAQSRC